VGTEPAVPGADRLNHFRRLANALVSKIQFRTDIWIHRICLGCRFVVHVLYTKHNDIGRDFLTVFSRKS
jgi:hypothetical protein